MTVDKESYKRRWLKARDKAVEVWKKVYGKDDQGKPGAPLNTIENFKSEQLKYMLDTKQFGKVIMTRSLELAYVDIIAETSKTDSYIAPKLCRLRNGKYLLQSNSVNGEELTYVSEENMPYVACMVQNIAPIDFDSKGDNNLYQFFCSLGSLPVEFFGMGENMAENQRATKVMEGLMPILINNYYAMALNSIDYMTPANLDEDWKEDKRKEKYSVACEVADLFPDTLKAFTSGMQILMSDINESQQGKEKRTLTSLRDVDAESYLGEQ